VLRPTVASFRQDLVRLGVSFAVHFVIGWVYIWLSIRKLPLHPDAAASKGNPFTSQASSEKDRKH